MNIKTINKPLLSCVQLEKSSFSAVFHMWYSVFISEISGHLRVICDAHYCRGLPLRSWGTGVQHSLVISNKPILEMSLAHSESVQMHGVISNPFRPNWVFERTVSSLMASRVKSVFDLLSRDFPPPRPPLLFIYHAETKQSKPSKTLCTKVAPRLFQKHTDFILNEYQMF